MEVDEPLGHNLESGPGGGRRGGDGRVHHHRGRDRRVQQAYSGRNTGAWALEHNHIIHLYTIHVHYRSQKALVHMRSQGTLRGRHLMTCLVCFPARHDGQVRRSGCLGREYALCSYRRLELDWQSELSARRSGDREQRHASYHLTSTPLLSSASHFISAHLSSLV